MLKFLKRSKPGLIGLDISSSAIKLLELGLGPDGYVVESYGAEPLPENAVVEQEIVDLDAVSEAIKRLKSTTKAKAKAVAVAVAGSAVITKTIEVPASLKEDQIE